MTIATETEPSTETSGRHSGDWPTGAGQTSDSTGESGFDVDVFGAAQQAACDQLAELVGRAAACRATGVPRSSWYRDNRVSPLPPRPAPTPHTERVQPRALSQAERARVRELLNTEPYLDAAPATVWAKLLDTGEYYCSISTLYRILREHGELTERRRQATHPPRKKPELLATGPNGVWSWDITKLAGPPRGVWYHLYVIIDIYSRYTPGWMIAETEDGELARRFLRESITKHGINGDTLTLHADWGTSMKSKTVAEMLSDLRVATSHSRPKTSNDNPYNQSQFTTLKYRPVFPDRLDSIGHAREFCAEFFDWYNHDHQHSGIGLHTPASVHFANRHGDPTAARHRPRRHLHREPRTVRPRHPPTTEAARCRLDQPRAPALLIFVWFSRFG